PRSRVARRSDPRGRSGAADIVRRRARVGRQPDPLDGTGGTMTVPSPQVAMVTGGSRGIGRACAEAPAREGWSGAIGSRSSEADAKETLASLETIGTPGLAVAVGVPA